MVLEGPIQEVSLPGLTFAASHSWMAVLGFAIFIKMLRQECVRFARSAYVKGRFAQ